MGNSFGPKWGFSLDLDKALEEAHEAVKVEGWKEVNAALVLMEHAKKESDCLNKEFGTLHNFLDERALDYRRKGHPNV